MKIRAEAGRHLFLNKLEAVLQSSGFNVSFHLDDPESEVIELGHAGFHLRWMQDPVTDRGLSIRRNYIDPFWKIEKSGARWNWPIVQRSFDASTIDVSRASRFAASLRERVFPGRPESPKAEGYVLVPLQGRLLQHRSFQTCSPLQMLGTLLQYERKRDIVLTLHPGEHYTDWELEALKNACEGHARVTVSNVDTKQLIQSCDYIVTQNSSVALWGFLLRKPAILFAMIDFHHVALQADESTLKSAIDLVGSHNPDYDRYLWWFFQEQSINANKTEAEDKIARRLRNHGWPL
ncbi:MAG: hypothetical protein QNK19_03850 [Xanthomonadales bacterium]|nr:hypothetical protein [Xanthomonadales bacterium]